MRDVQPATAEEIERRRNYQAPWVHRLIATIDALTAGMTGDDRPSSLPTFERRAFKGLVAEVTARAEAAEAEVAALRAERDALTTRAEEAEALIESAIMAMAETQPSWGWRISRVLGAFGSDFGGPEEIDRAIRADVARDIGYDKEDAEADAAALRQRVEALTQERDWLRRSLELADADPIHPDAAALTQEPTP